MAKQCEWCDKTMSRTNYRRHLSTCVFKNVIDLRKSDVELLKKKQHRVDPHEETALMELKHYLTECYTKTSLLYKRIVQEAGRDPIEKIKEMRVSDQTRQNYLVEWKLFNKWLKENKKTMSVESANTYISSLKDCRASTQRKKQYMLQTLLQHVVDRSIKLDRFRMRISYIPKFALSNEELSKYLEEQKEIDQEDYLIQRLLSTYGLKINTLLL